MDNKDSRVVSVTCVGASTTENADAPECSWPSQMAEMLGSRFSVLNAGASGSNVIRDKRANFPYSTSAQYQTALSSDPDIVIIMLGGNDCGAHWYESGIENPEKEFEKDYNALVDEFEDLSKRPVIILAKQTYCFSDPLRQRLTHDIVNPIVEKIGKERAYTVVDMEEYTKDHEEWNTDGLHFTDEGNKKLAEFFKLAVLKQAIELQAVELKAIKLKEDK